MDSEQVRVWKEMVVAKLKSSLSGHLPGGTKKYHKTHRTAGNPSKLRTGYFSNTKLRHSSLFHRPNPGSTTGRVWVNYLGFV
jgi:hypothetical protein